MNSLLRRQIQKMLTKEIAAMPELEKFLEAIDRSYDNYDEQFHMLQRAMSISSTELFDANLKLREEAKQQQNVIDSLMDTTKTLRSITYSKDKGNNNVQELSGIELANHIEKQAVQIAQIEQQREAIFSDLEKSNQELQDYAHVVSHDLKSPLRTINTLINWIYEEESTVHLNDTIKDYLKRIDKNIEKMDNLISGILEYSVVDKKNGNTTNVDTHTLVEEIISLLEVPSHIMITIEGTLPVVHVDRMRLKQVFQNLLNNALKAIDKPHGTIRIASEDSDAFWKFTITDNGKGIPEKYHKKIFQIFQSLDHTKTSTGIGLSIVKKIIDFYQGRIWVTSTPDIGTTFHFNIKKTKT